MAEITGSVLPASHPLRAWVWWAHQFGAGPFIWTAVVPGTYWTAVRDRRGFIGGGVAVLQPATVSEQAVADLVRVGYPRVLIPLRGGEIFNQAEETVLHRYRCLAIFLLVLPETAAVPAPVLGRQVGPELMPLDRIDAHFLPATLRA